MTDKTLPHATTASEDTLKEAGNTIAAARAAAEKDDLGRIDELAISRQMAEWWKKKGYAFP